MPPHTQDNFLLTAKSNANLTFTDLTSHLPHRNEVSIASLFLTSHPPPTPTELTTLSNLFSIPLPTLEAHFSQTPDRGLTALDMPPKEPLMYRLYEIVLNYGASYRAVLNEMFGDGIMSAIAFSTKVEREVERDERTGVETQYAVITLRGKWLPYARF